jgi:hypothetical protein
MSASQILLAGHGPEDRWLTETPNRTYFEAKYQPRINRLRETFEVPFDNRGVTFGTTGICTVPVKGDYLTSLTLRAVLPPIYPTVPGQFVFPTPSSQVGGTVYVNMGLTQVLADGVTLTANTVGNHYFSIGAGVILVGTAYNIFDLDNTYTIASIPTANSFTCLTSLAGISYNGTVSSPGIVPSDAVGYFSTTNSNLWVNNITNKTWQITAGTNIVGLVYTFTTSAPSNLPVGSTVILNLPNSNIIDELSVVTASTDTTFTCTITSLYSSSLSDSVSLVVPPLELTNRVFSSNVYQSISFANESDSAFWGFDSREGLTYFLTATPPWTLTQSGWISGFLPPSTSTYDDSVAHKLCKAVRILVGKQIIKEYTGEYIELQNDLTVSYENKAVLKLMNGTLDQTQATFFREYYTTLPLGTKEIPLCALTNQQVSVEIDFESFTNLSQNLNSGTGDFLDSKSYTSYDASTGLLNGQPVNIQSTLSYQQYIFTITYDGNIILYDTTKPIDDQNSYIVVTAFAGPFGLFSKFCILGGIIYIQLVNGFLIKGILDEIIQGNTSSFVSNNYLPTLPGDIDSPTGTMVADARYIYYAVSNLASSVFVVSYDTQSPFGTSTGYASVDFTQTFDPNVTGLYQILSTGTELIVVPEGTPGSLYTYQLNANVQSQWYTLNYSSYGTQITEGVLIGSSVYFILDNFNILKYTDSSFSIPSSPSITIPGDALRNLIAVGNYIYCSTNSVAVQIDTTQDLSTAAAYEFPAPLPIGQYVFANGPRFIYIFSQDPGQTTTPTNIVRFDPYPPVPVLQTSILVDYESLPEGVKKPDKALLGLIQTQRVTDMNYMNIRGPVKELWVTGTSDSANVFQYSNLATVSTLELAGEQIVTDDDGTRTFLNVIEPFETHTSMPIRNVSVISFEFDPESAIPNGTINFSRIRDQIFRGDAQTVWARTYNLLAIQGGIGGLIFDS